MSEPEDRELLAVLERARGHGHLGPGPVTDHLDHARGFAAIAVDVLTRVPATVVDLGTGGGVPGLVLACEWPETQMTFVDASERRGADLRQAVADLGIGERVTVRTARAEDVAHEAEQREQAELVTARSFGPPPLTAEIAAGFVAIGGLLLVSEPPGGDPERWPDSAVAGLGYSPATTEISGGRTYAALRKVAPAPARIPRPTRQLVKRPAW